MMWCTGPTGVAEGRRPAVKSVFRVAIKVSVKLEPDHPK